MRTHVERAAGGPRLGEFLLLAGLVLAFTARLTFTNQILARGDTFLYFYPLWDYRAEALRAGRLPLWAPELFMGAPFLANSQTGVLYPLNWPLAGLPAPQAVKVSLGLHLFIAGAGALVFARRRLGVSAAAGLLTASVFALGGYLLAQAEHINQLQALAWFPWLLWALGLADGRRRLAAAGGLIALPVLAGHTQSVFISLTGAALFGLAEAWPRRWPALRDLPAHPLVHLAGALALAALLAGAQWLPTLELSRQSLRSGGLPWAEALSFSLDPRLLGRALLPGYSRSFFTEFVAYSGVLGLGLAALGVSRARPALALLVLAAAGLGAALGAFNPLYAGLALFPPVNLFRVPARWLVLTAFGLAGLAGLGLDRLVQAPAGNRWRPALRAGLAPALLLAAAPLANALTPAGETGPLGAPALSDLAGWLAALAALVGLAAWPRPAGWRRPVLLGLGLLELWAASLALPLNHLTAPEAYTSLRPAMTQLLLPAETQPPARFLSLSALRFDPGDLAELRGAFGPQLTAAALDDLIVATKHKEVLSPNLPLAWGVPAVDGFDGGILPLRAYAAFTQLFTGAASPDGRLRENLRTAPDPRLLALVNARWLITDKVNDAWIEGVYYDQEFTLTLAAGEAAVATPRPAFAATAVGLVGELSSGALEVTDTAGRRLTLPAAAGRLRLPAPTEVASLRLIGPLTVRGLSLVDERTGAFQTVTLGPYRLAHSGDVKVYEHQAVLPRAFVIQAAVSADDEAAARALLADPAFDPARTAVLEASAGWPGVDAPTAGLSAVITDYTPEAVRVTAAGPGLLILTDAFYPGWTATLDGQPAPILRADILFRAVALPAGPHRVEFRFQPNSLRAGAVLSGLGLLALVALLLPRRQ